MARLRFPGRPGQRFGRASVKYYREEANIHADQSVKLTNNIQRGLKLFYEVFGESDEDDYFEGFTEGELSSAPRRPNFLRQSAAQNTIKTRSSTVKEDEVPPEIQQVQTESSSQNLAVFEEKPIQEKPVLEPNELFHSNEIVNSENIDENKYEQLIDRITENPLKEENVEKPPQCTLRHTRNASHKTYAKLLKTDIVVKPKTLQLKANKEVKYSFPSKPPLLNDGTLAEMSKKIKLAKIKSKLSKKENMKSVPVTILEKTAPIKKHKNPVGRPPKYLYSIPVKKRKRFKEQLIDKPPVEPPAKLKSIKIRIGNNGKTRIVHGNSPENSLSPPDQNHEQLSNSKSKMVCIPKTKHVNTSYARQLVAKAKRGNWKKKNTLVSPEHKSDPHSSLEFVAPSIERDSESEFTIDIGRERKFVLPAVSNRSSRVIIPCKRFMEDVTKKVKKQSKLDSSSQNPVIVGTNQPISLSVPESKIINRSETIKTIQSVFTQETDQIILPPQENQMIPKMPEPPPKKIGLLDQPLIVEGKRQWKPTLKVRLKLSELKSLRVLSPADRMKNRGNKSEVKLSKFSQNIPKKNKLSKTHWKKSRSKMLLAIPTTPVNISIPSPMIKTRSSSRLSSNVTNSSCSTLLSGKNILRKAKLRLNTRTLKKLRQPSSLATLTRQFMKEEPTVQNTLHQSPLQIKGTIMRTLDPLNVSKSLTFSAFGPKDSDSGLFPKEGLFSHSLLKDTVSKDTPLKEGFFKERPLFTDTSSSLFKDVSVKLFQDTALREGGLFRDITSDQNSKSPFSDGVAKEGLFMESCKKEGLIKDSPIREGLFADTSLNEGARLFTDVASKDNVFKESSSSEGLFKDILTPDNKKIFPSSVPISCASPKDKKEEKLPGKRKSKRKVKISAVSKLNLRRKKSKHEETTNETEDDHGEHVADIRRCVICGDVKPSPQVCKHYGADSCQPCRGFYRRNFNKAINLVCDNDGQCPVTPASRFHCRSCWLKRCHQFFTASPINTSPRRTSKSPSTASRGSSTASRSPSVNSRSPSTASRSPSTISNSTALSSTVSSLLSSTSTSLSSSTLNSAAISSTALNLTTACSTALSSTPSNSTASNSTILGCTAVNSTASSNTVTGSASTSSIAPIIDVASGKVLEQEDACVTSKIKKKKVFPDRRILKSRIAKTKRYTGGWSPDKDQPALLVTVSTSTPEEEPSLDDPAAGPRIKHVCRRAAVALGGQIQDDSALTLSGTAGDSSHSVMTMNTRLSSIRGQTREVTPSHHRQELYHKYHNKAGTGKRRKIRCRECPGCVADDCGKCTNCKDKPKFGGPNVMKQACQYRKCLNPRYAPSKVKKKSKQSLVKKGLSRDCSRRGRRDDNESSKKGGVVADCLEEESSHGSSNDNSSAALGKGYSSAFNSNLSKSSSNRWSTKPKVIGRSGAVTGIGKSSKDRWANHLAKKQLQAAKKTVRAKDKEKTSQFSKTDGNGGNMFSLTNTKSRPVNYFCNPRDQLIKVDYRENYDHEEMWKRGYALISSQQLVVRVVCYLCGSKGKQEFIYCNVCCEPFHSYCLDENDRPSCDDQENWCCRNCQFCHVCGRQKNLLKCDKCRNTYHAACLEPNYPTKPSRKKKIWICTKCVRCKSCGATTPGLGYNAQWTYDFSLCFDCGKLMDKGNYCPICKKCYEDDDYDSKMVQCGTCDCWVHSRCDDISDEMYQILSYLPDNIVYTCRRCSPDRPAPWEAVVKEELQAGIFLVLNALLNSKSAKHMLKIRDKSKDFSPKCKPAKQSKCQKALQHPSREEIQDTSDNLKSMSGISPKEIKEHSAVLAEIRDLEDRIIAEELLALRTSVSPRDCLGNINIGRCNGKNVDSGVNFNVQTNYSEAGSSDKQTMERYRNIPDGQTESCAGSELPGVTQLGSMMQDSTSRSRTTCTPPSPHRTSTNINPERTQDTSKHKDYCSESVILTKENKVLDPPQVTLTTRDLQGVKLNFEQGKYETVEQFCDDVVCILQNAINNESDENPVHRKANSTVRTMFIKQMEKAFPWFNVTQSKLWDHNKNLPEGLLRNAVVPPYSDHTYAQYLEREDNSSIVQPAPFRKPPVTSDNVRPPGFDEVWCRGLEPEGPVDLEDPRKCLFCNKYGDDEPNDSGRLVYCSQDDWVHVNCAVWSAEVFEELDGSLQNVHAAVSRGRQMKCEECKEPGATVGCCMRGCPANYHFMCARVHKCVFQTDKKVYCQQHLSKVDGELIEDGDFAVSRCIYIDLENLFNKWLKRTWQRGLEPSTTNLIVGSMTLEGLGQLGTLSDMAEGLFPINYTVTRVYWSTINPRQRVIYTCRILEFKLVTEEGETVVENSTIKHEESITSNISSANDIKTFAEIPKKEEPIKITKPKKDEVSRVLTPNPQLNTVSTGSNTSPDKQFNKGVCSESQETSHPSLESPNSVVKSPVKKDHIANINTINLIKTPKKADNSPNKSIAGNQNLAMNNLIKTNCLKKNELNLSQNSNQIPNSKLYGNKNMADLLELKQLNTDEFHNGDQQWKSPLKSIKKYVNNKQIKKNCSNFVDLCQIPNTSVTGLVEQESNHLQNAVSSLIDGMQELNKDHSIDGATNVVNELLNIVDGDITKNDFSLLKDLESLDLISSDTTTSFDGQMNVGVERPLELNDVAQKVLKKYPLRRLQVNKSNVENPNALSKAEKDIQSLEKTIKAEKQLTENIDNNGIYNRLRSTPARRSNLKTQEIAQLSALADTKNLNSAEGSSSLLDEIENSGDAPGNATLSTSDSTPLHDRILLKIKAESLARSTPSHKGPFKCPKCKRSYRTKQSFSTHVQQCNFEVESSSSDEEDTQEGNNHLKRYPLRNSRNRINYEELGSLKSDSDDDHVPLENTASEVYAHVVAPIIAMEQENSLLKTPCSSQPSYHTNPPLQQIKAAVCATVPTHDNSENSPVIAQPCPKSSQAITAFSQQNTGATRTLPQQASVASLPCTQQTRQATSIFLQEIPVTNALSHKVPENTSPVPLQTSRSTISPSQQILTATRSVSQHPPIATTSSHVPQLTVTSSQPTPITNHSFSQQTPVAISLPQQIPRPTLSAAQQISVANPSFSQQTPVAISLPQQIPRPTPPAQHLSVASSSFSQHTPVAISLPQQIPRPTPSAQQTSVANPSFSQQTPVAISLPQQIPRPTPSSQQTSVANPSFSQQTPVAISLPQQIPRPAPSAQQTSVVNPSFSQQTPVTISLPQQIPRPAPPAQRISMVNQSFSQQTPVTISLPQQIPRPAPPAQQVSVANPSFLQQTPVATISFPHVSQPTPSPSQHTLVANPSFSQQTSVAATSFPQQVSRINPSYSQHIPVDTPSFSQQTPVTTISFSQQVSRPSPSTMQQISASPSFSQQTPVATSSYRQQVSQPPRPSLQQTSLATPSFSQQTSAIFPQQASVTTTAFPHHMSVSNKSFPQQTSVANTQFLQQNSANPSFPQQTSSPASYSKQSLVAAASFSQQTLVATSSFPKQTLAPSNTLIHHTVHDASPAVSATENNVAISTPMSCNNEYVSSCQTNDFRHQTPLTFQGQNISSNNRSSQTQPVSIQIPSPNPSCLPVIIPDAISSPVSLNQMTQVQSINSNIKSLGPINHQIRSPNGKNHVTILPKLTQKLLSPIQSQDVPSVISGPSSVQQQMVLMNQPLTISAQMNQDSVNSCALSSPKICPTIISGVSGMVTNSNMTLSSPMIATNLPSGTRVIPVPGGTLIVPGKKTFPNMIQTNQQFCLPRNQLVQQGIQQGSFVQQGQILHQGIPQGSLVQQRQLVQSDVQQGSQFQQGRLVSLSNVNYLGSVVVSEQSFPSQMAFTLSANPPMTPGNNSIGTIDLQPQTPVKPPQMPQKQTVGNCVNFDANLNSVGALQQTQGLIGLPRTGLPTVNSVMDHQPSIPSLNAQTTPPRFSVGTMNMQVDSKMGSATTDLATFQAIANNASKTWTPNLWRNIVQTTRNFGTTNTIVSSMPRIAPKQNMARHSMPMMPHTEIVSGVPLAARPTTTATVQKTCYQPESINGICIPKQHTSSATHTISQLSQNTTITGGLKFTSVSSTMKTISSVSTDPLLSQAIMPLDEITFNHISSESKESPAVFNKPTSLRELLANSSPSLSVISTNQTIKKRKFFTSNNNATKIWVDQNGVIHSQLGVSKSDTVVPKSLITTTTNNKVNPQMKKRYPYIFNKPLVNNTAGVLMNATCAPSLVDNSEEIPTKKKRKEMHTMELQQKNQSMSHSKVTSGLRRVRIHSEPLPQPELMEEVDSSPLLAIMEHEQKMMKEQQEKKKIRTGPHLVFEITSEDGFHIQSDDISEAWKILTDKLQDARAVARMKQLSFAGVNGLTMLGVTHHAISYLLEQLLGAQNCHNYKFVFHKYEAPEEEIPENPSGCARCEPFNSRSDYDMFNFLASKHRTPPEYQPITEEEEMQHKSARRATSMDLPMAMRFRHLRTTAREAVGVYRSKIHGRGLFCKRNIDAGEMVIEYAGEVIRSVLTDKREKYYESKGIGCYMFRIDDQEVVDATMHGNAARFINHSCEPNCFSRVIQVDGKKHIVIFALRPILRGEELTYDYKFPIEDIKIPCSCGSRKCRKYLN